MSVPNQIPVGGPTVPSGSMDMSEFYKGHWLSQEAAQPTIVQAFGIIGTIFWLVRLSLQVARNFERGKIIEFGGDDCAELGRRCGLGECLLSILRFLASMSSVLFLPLAAIGMHLAIAHAFASFYPLIIVILLHLNVVMLMIIGCQDLSSVFVRNGRWDVGRAVCTFAGIIPVLLICSAMFELFATSMALDSDYCFGRSGTGFVKGEGVPNPCAVGMGVIAASAVGFNYFPLALESYKHQGRSVSVNGLGLFYGIAGMHFSWLALKLRNPFDREGVAFFAVIAACETMLGAAHLVWCLRTRKVRASAASQGLTFDEYMDAYLAQGGPSTFAASRKYTRAPSSTSPGPYSTPSTAPYIVDPISSADVDEHHNRVWRRVNAYLESEQSHSQRFGRRLKPQPQQRQEDGQRWDDIPLQDMGSTFGATVLRPDRSHAGTRARLDDFDDYDGGFDVGCGRGTRPVSPRRFV